ncbi:hypothetical protein KO518_01445, partial [Aestuariibacter sp. A3R04]|nr:hypothetical protein [Aestuariibacter sp. A3R04]
MFNSKKVGSTVAVATFISLLGGCGSIGSDDDTWLTGNFIDSAVEGVEYRASGETGITDAEGTFRYKKGDSVSFSIGGIQLGTVAGDTLITPYSFSVSGGNEATDIVINIARLLQTLDEDGDPENGILITEAIRLEAENLTMMLDQSAETFAEDSAVAAAFTQLGAHLSYNFERVKSINDAMAHLDATLSGDSGSDGGD